MWLLKDERLSVAVERWLHPELRARLGYINAMRAELRAHKWNPSPGWSADWRDTLNWLRGLRIPGTMAWTIPYLSPEFCEMLLAEVGPQSFEPNDSEEPEYQIPEVVLHNECPQLFRTLKELMVTGLFPLIEVLRGNVPEMIGSIQFARYNPQGTSHGNWHHDEDSTVTFVTSLNPDGFKGGGTELWPDITQSPVFVPPLPVGHGLLFNGSDTLHRGLNVTEGDRYLLVHWMEHKQRCIE